jgi:hypothetical protein
MNRAPQRSLALFLSVFSVLCISVSANAASGPAKSSKSDSASISGAGYRFETGGWTYVHLEGDAAQIGY